MRTADHAVRVEQLLCNRHRLCNEIGQFWFEPQLAFPLIFDENPPIASWHRHCPPQQSGASSSPVQFERINSVSHLTRQTASDVDGRIAKVDFYAGSTHSGSRKAVDHKRRMSRGYHGDGFRAVARHLHRDSHSFRQRWEYSKLALGSVHKMTVRAHC